MSVMFYTLLRFVVSIYIGTLVSKTLDSDLTQRNCRTLYCVERCVTTLCRHYPAIINNSSIMDSFGMVNSLNAMGNLWHPII